VELNPRGKVVMDLDGTMRTTRTRLASASLWRNQHMQFKRGEDMTEF
jgi:hypothetical protein